MTTEAKKIEFNVLMENFTAIKTYSKSKIDSNGGAAPWMIGREVTTAQTNIFDSRGRYVMTFGFNFKMFRKNETYRKNILSQIEMMILGA